MVFECKVLQVKVFFLFFSNQFFNQHEFILLIMVDSDAICYSCLEFAIL